MAWTPQMLEHGPYFGVYFDDMLVSIGGVHFTTKWATEIGNVVTHFEHRRQNLAYKCTKAVSDNLHNTCHNIFLCVSADNIPAIRLYEKVFHNYIQRKDTLSDEDEEDLKLAINLAKLTIPNDNALYSRFMKRVNYIYPEIENEVK